jgi:CBS domain-containing protein
MSWTARDVMRAEVRTVAPDMALSDLERRFLEEHVSGFPVVEGGRLVGVVSRSDVVRQLSVERSVAESLSDYYRDVGAFDEDADESVASIGRQVGARIEGMRVADVMVHAAITGSPEEAVSDIARRLLERHIHRIPIVEAGRLVGIVTSLDLVRLFADGRAKPT